ncbi:MFS transporter [Streptomyces sp. DSM 44917]|uniref:MFS transporter n=1 Tax=Streptomyces boetiae TaxID=3075541 RepID=A0ABU2L7J7_9ACTN|nr:MFS transporter [Streptomyces sp. DSM 44917]MDT0307544.1 MFS transporter [Streptomyces sp. DSM 44917]
MTDEPRRAPAPSTASRRTRITALLLGMLLLTLEGYDTVAFGATVPLLLGPEPWNLSLSDVGLLGSVTPMGMLVGALAVGQFTDRYGRRRTVLLSLLLVTVGMPLCAMAPSVAVFVAGRFLVGVGVGVVFPALTPLIFELAPPGRKNLYAAIIGSGFGLGGALSAVVANTIAAEHGFRAEYAVGGAFGLLILPLLYRWLPESPGFGAAPGAPVPAAAATAGEETGLRLVLSRRYAATTVLFTAAVACSFLLIYGVNTWLPELMRAADYSLGSALTFLVFLNLGAALGMLFIAAVADRLGTGATVVACFLIAAAGVVLLSFRSPMPALYGIVLITGTAAIGNQALVNTHISSSYPLNARGSAIGVALGVGRVGAIIAPTVGGWILAAGFEPRLNFVLFALPAVAGALLVWCIPRPARGSAGAGDAVPAAVGGGREAGR